MVKKYYSTEENSIIMLIVCGVELEVPLNLSTVLKKMAAFI
jgi:hypothetical protein